MKKIAIICTALLLTFGLYFGNNALAKRAEIEAVKVPLENYIMGHKTGKKEYMRKAFHTEGKLIFIRDGKYTTVEFKDFVGGKDGSEAKDEALRKRYIESIDVTANTAVGKIVLDYPDVRIVDYMSLLKINGEWKIVNKIFSGESKKKKKDGK